MMVNKLSFNNAKCLLDGVDGWESNSFMERSDTKQQAEDGSVRNKHDRTPNTKQDGFGMTLFSDAKEKRDDTCCWSAPSFFFEATNSSEPFTIPVKDVDSFEHNRSDNFTRMPGPSIQSAILTTEHLASKKSVPGRPRKVFRFYTILSHILHPNRF